MQPAADLKSRLDGMFTHYRKTHKELKSALNANNGEKEDFSRQEDAYLRHTSQVGMLKTNLGKIIQIQNNKSKSKKLSTSTA